jgi:predicted Zn finger-like uncharacterized protein
MIITCPGCATRYEVPDAAFNSEGRRVRCQSCGFVWHAVPDDALADDAAPLWDRGAIGDIFDIGLPPALDRDDGADPDDPGPGFAGEPDMTGMAGNPDFDLANHLAEAERLERNLASVGRAREHTHAAAAPARRRPPPGPLAIAACLALALGALYEYREAVVRAVPGTAAVYELAGLDVNIRGMEFANVIVAREFDNGLPVLAVRGEIVNITGRPLEVPRLRFGLRDQAEQEIYHWTMAVATDRLAAEQRVSFATRLAAPPAAAHDVEVRFHDVGSRRADG